MEARPGLSVSVDGISNAKDIANMFKEHFSVKTSYSGNMDLQMHDDRAGNDAQETKWKGARAREIGQGYKFYYCGSNGKRNGVGIVLDSQLKQGVTNVNRKSDRIIALKVMLENWNEEVQEILKQKKQAFREWQKVKAGQETEEAIKRTKHMECKKMAKRAVAIARTAAQDKLYNSLNSPQGEKQLYRLAKARERSSRDVSYIKCVKDDAGRVLSKDEVIRERWKGYFERLMNEENDWNPFTGA
ncbi:uncharacterized protein LOC134679187 [Cydia fagiglandana]|uniref:uncharacterized protein LOC134679187 n=1 Tax=Cydia fagiglandana TaxID=1458189 RepID=UPI002FEE0E4F